MTAPAEIPLVQTIAPVNNWYYQLANALFLISYLIPNLFLLRVVLILGGLFFVIFCAFSPALILDGLIWNAVFSFINLVHASYLAYQMRHVTLCKDEELVYQALYASRHYPLSRREFKDMVNLGTYRNYSAGEHYAVRTDKIEKLGFLCYGKFSVLLPDDSGELVTVNSIDDRQFLDSPEWVQGDSDPRQYSYNIHLVALEDSVVFELGYKAVCKIRSDPVLCQALDFSLSRDLFAKLWTMGKQMVLRSQLGHQQLVTQSGAYRMPRSVFEDDNLVENDKGVCVVDPSQLPPTMEDAHEIELGTIIQLRERHKSHILTDVLRPMGKFNRKP